MAQMLISFAIFLIFGAICAVIARQKGRDPVAWSIFGMLFCLLALIVLLLLPSLSPQQDIEENEDDKLAGIKPNRPFEKRYQQNEWFYIGEEKNTQGPVGFSFLKKIWEEGRVSSDSFVWSEGMQKWERIKDLEGFEDALSPSPFLEYPGVEG